MEPPDRREVSGMVGPNPNMLLCKAMIPGDAPAVSGLGLVQGSTLAARSKIIFIDSTRNVDYEPSHVTSKCGSLGVSEEHSP